MADEILTREEMETEMHNWWFSEMFFYYDDETLGEVLTKTERGA